MAAFDQDIARSNWTEDFGRRARVRRTRSGVAGERIVSGQAIVRWLARIAADGRSSDAMAAARALAELPRSSLAVVRVHEDALGGLAEISPRRLEAALDELTARQWVEAPSDAECVRVEQHTR